MSRDNARLAASAIGLALFVFILGYVVALRPHSPQCDQTCQQRESVAQNITDIANLSIDNPSAMWMMNQVATLELKKPIYRKPWARNVRRALVLFAQATKREATHRLCHWKFDPTDQTWIGDNCDDVDGAMELLREYADDLPK